jgi:hypothetical protein
VYCNFAVVIIPNFVWCVQPLETACEHFCSCCVSGITGQNVVNITNSCTVVYQEQTYSITPNKTLLHLFPKGKYVVEIYLFCLDANSENWQMFI